MKNERNNTCRRSPRGWPRPSRSAFVSMIEQYQGMTISSPEEIAYHMGWIDDERLSKSIKRYGKSPYGERLKAVREGKVVL